MGKFSEITWLSECIELKKIKDLLLCGICYEYMETSVMTPCSHNYCSLCIRKYLHYKTQCPACFEKTFEKDLHTNRILDEIIRYFIRIGEKLEIRDTCTNEAEVQIDRNIETHSIVANSPSIKPARSNRVCRTPQKLTKSVSDGPEDSIFKAQSNTVLGSTPKNMLSPSTSGTVMNSSIFAPKSRKDLRTGEDGKKVVCPVCSVEIFELHINRHLDDCLKRESVKKSSPKADPKHKPLPKLVFNLMKDAQIRKILRDHGLSTQGDRKTLEMRFQRYSVLYNAECDKQEPRSIADLIKQCEEEELVEKKMQKSAFLGNRLQVNRKTDQSVVEEAQKKYLEMNKTSFQTLIEDIKSRDNSKKSIKRGILNQGNTDIAAKRQTINECVSNITDESNESNFFYALDRKEFIPQDSDSNSYCPLQWYTSDDPMNYVSVEINSNEESDQNTSPSSFKKCLITPQSPRYAATISDYEDSSSNRIDASSKKDGKYDFPVSFSDQISKSNEVENSKISTSDISANNPFTGTTDSDSTDPEGTFASARQEKRSINKRTKSKKDGKVPDQMKKSIDANLEINIPETPMNDDPFNVVTDSNSSDSEGTVTSGRRQKKSINKRAKLCPSNRLDEKNISLTDVLAESELPSIQKRREEDCRNLARSIAKDFSFDSSSNDSVDPGINDGTEKTFVRKMDKENIESSTSDNIVCKPSEKNSLDPDPSNNETTKPAKRSRTNQKRILDEQDKNERSHNNECVDIRSKRKRGSQKHSSSTVDEPKNTPRRFTRKRNVNAM